MKSMFIKTALASALLSAGVCSTAMAHSIVGGQLNSTASNIDVYRTTCVSLTSGSIASQGLTGIQPGPASGFVFAVNLTQGNNITATVGYTFAGNISGPNQDGNIGGSQTTAEAGDPNNTLPAKWYLDSSSNEWQTVLTATASDTSLGPKWTSETNEPAYAYFNISSPFGTTGYLDGASNNPSGNGNGEYVIVLSRPTSQETHYDFIGHCVNKSLGSSILTAHTGQGTWFTQGATGANPGAPALVDLSSSGQDIVSSADYDQVIGDDLWNNGTYPPLSSLPTSNPIYSCYSTYCQ